MKTIGRLISFALILLVAQATFAGTPVKETAAGYQLGDSSDDKIGFQGATPVARQANTASARATLETFGLLATGGTDPYLSDTTDDSLADGVDVGVGSTTGTKIGTATTQKLGFHNATPTVQRAGADQAALSALTTAALGGTLTGVLDNTLADTPTLTDTPATADALRDDFHTNVKPVIDKNFKELQDELSKTAADLAAARTLINELRAGLVEKGLIKGEP